jgi:REP element-mobilizing transposase RayT
VTDLITRRCIERRFLLRPSRVTNQIVEYCLGVAAERSGVELHVFCAMSNHVHAVLTDVDGRLPEFFHHFHRNVAVALNASLGRSENVWAVGQTSAVELGDQWDVLEKMAYVVANPTAAGLVRSPQKWPGVITTKLCEAKTVKRPTGFFRTEGNMPERTHLKYTVPAQLEHLGERKVSELFFRAVSEKVHAARAKALADGRPFLGPKAVLATAISKAASTDEGIKGRNPRFAIRDARLRRHAIAIWRGFLVAYREAFHQWRSGERAVRFPEGTWMMARVHRATCGPPGSC